MRSRGALSAGLLLALLATAAAAASQQQQPETSSRLSVDFSSHLTVSPEPAPPPVVAAIDALLADMRADGVDNACSGRLEAQLCPGQDRSPGADCRFCVPAVAAGAAPCSCAGANNTRCACVGRLTAEQYFSPSLHGLEIARALVVSKGETSRVAGGINANFNTTVRLTGGAKVVRAPAGRRLRAAAAVHRTRSEPDCGTPRSALQPARRSL